MIITKIEAQKKHKNRSSVFLDGEFAFGISDFEVFRFHLKEGQDLTEDALETIRSEVLCQDAKRYALGLLDRQNYTEKAMRRKLSDRGCDKISIDTTITFLKDYNYLDDTDFARRYVTAALKGGKSGLRKIQFDLQNKGISRDVIEIVLAELDEEILAETEQETVSALLEKKLKGDYSFPNLMKAKRYCLSRGFSSKAIDNAISFLKNDSEDWLSD